MLLAGTSAAALESVVGSGEAVVLRGRSDHHKPTPIINSRASPTTVGRNFRALDFDAGSVFSTRVGCFSHGRMMRNKSIGMEMFFNSVGANFSKRASSELRICRSTSIETQMPPARQPLDARSDVYSIAVNVAGSMDDITNVNADSDFDTSLERHVIIALG